jgi:DNA-binding IscR family transcriptional regulator
MVRAGLVRSQRGLHGGFVLTRAPDDLTIWDVVDAVEPIKRIRECPIGLDTHQASLCPLHRRLDHALALVEQSFRESTVAELLGEPGSVTPLCETEGLTQIGRLAGKKAPKKKKKKKKKARR